MDKARTGFPIAITFTDGELPTPAKLTSLAKQARRGLQLMEYAVGDIWNQGGDSILAKTSETADEPLMIPNLGRALGSPRLVSPRIPALPSIASYVHSFLNEVNTHEARLPFVPAVGSTWGWNGTNPPSGAPQTDKYLVDSANKWWIDTVSGHPADMYFFDTVQSDWELTYIPSVVGDIDSNATYNIIPDPDTDSACGFQGLKLEYFNGEDGTQGYKIYLPPRQPLNLRRLDCSPQDDIHTPVVTGNQTTTPGDAFLTFWQDDSVAAETGANAEHYRYTLPKIITDNWSNSATIPGGLVYLWDPRGTGTIIEGVVFAAEAAATPKTWYLVATGSNLTAWLSTSYGLAAYSDDNLKLTTHGAELYPTNGLRLITVGTSVAQLASATHQQFMDHDHGSQGSMTGKPVPHSKLSGLLLEGTSPQFVPSKLTYDDHVMYFERHGYSANRDQYRNMIMGNLVLASIGANDGYENTAADSNCIYLGGKDTSYSSRIFWEYNIGRTVIHTMAPEGGTTTGLRIRNASYSSTRYLDIDVEEENVKIAPYTNGNLILNSGGNYLYPNQAINFAVPLGAGYGDIISSTEAATLGWKCSGSGSGTTPQRIWQTESSSKQLVFYLTDFPNGFYMTAMIFNYSITNPDGTPPLPCEGSLFYGTSLDPDNGTRLEITEGRDVTYHTHGGGMTGTNGTMQTQTFTLITPRNLSRTDNGGHLGILFSSWSGNAETIKIWPIVVLCGYFTSSSCWKKHNASSS